MPALANITANDGETTPVAHTFKPQRIEGNVATFVESTGVPLADKRISVSVSRTADKNRGKISFRLAWPIVADQTINGVVSPLIVRTAYVDVTVSTDQTSSKQERKNARVLLKNILESSSLATVIDELESYY